MLIHPPPYPLTEISPSHFFSLFKATKAFKKFLPLFDRVLVERFAAEKTTKGGIMIPEKAQERVLKAIVVAVGPGTRTDVSNLSPQWFACSFSFIFLNLQNEQTIWICALRFWVVNFVFGWASTKINIFQYLMRSHRTWIVELLAHRVWSPTFGTFLWF